ncbi:MAG: tetratricopeptide repeat protein [Acidobacteriia bacterium]|nr:tetratricopeptide repeat protein [Terriglobia bacterium]
MEATTTGQAPAREALWIYNPALDLIVGCGAWSAPLLLFAYAMGNSNLFAWSVAFYALALFFNYPHYMATLYRAYHTAEDFHRYRIFTVHITLVVALTVVLSHFYPRLLPWVFTLYLTWSPWHYTGQNYGLFMMFARRAGAQPSRAERHAIYWAFLLSYLILFVGFHTGPSSDPLFVSLGIPGRVSTALSLALAAGFVACSGFGLWRLTRALGLRDLVPPLAVFSTQFLWFLLPTVLSLTRGWQVPQSRYSTGVLAVMHAAQYLWITSYYARREATAAGVVRWRPLAYFGVLVLGGIALFVPGPWLASYVFHFDFTSSFLIFTALVNIHHFILDGAIWKLRDSRIASLLIDSKPQAFAAPPGRLTATARRLLGTSWLARAVRIAVAVLVLMWAGLDQVRYAQVVDGALPRLQAAATLNPFDASLQMRIARKQADAGAPDQAADAWQRAADADPSNPVPRIALLRYLIEQKRFPDAYRLTRGWLARAPRDADLLVNHGILARQLGHTEEAVESWQKALAISPAQINSHLYLADALESQGKFVTAIAHYAAYLDGVARAGLENRPPANETAAVVLKLARCQAQAKQPAQAEVSYRLADTLVERSGNPKLIGAVLAEHAEWEATQGNSPDALRLYQRTLKLYEGINDPGAEAAAWYHYGLFLRDRGLPSRLAYASLLKSESLLPATSDSGERDTVSRARKEVEKSLGAEAAAIRRNPKPAISEAAALTM